MFVATPADVGNAPARTCREARPTFAVLVGVVAPHSIMEPGVVRVVGQFNQIRMEKGSLEPTGRGNAPAGAVR